MNCAMSSFGNCGKPTGLPNLCVVSYEKAHLLAPRFIGGPPTNKKGCSK